MVTANEVLSWLNANQGHGYDYDGIYGVQCVDLINEVDKRFLGNTRLFTTVPGAKDIWNVSLPAGWSKHSTSQPGDIFVSGPEPTNEYGHTGIVAEDNDNVYDENYAGRKYISRHTRAYIPNMIGFIRPPYGGNSDNNTEEVEMYIIQTKDTGRCYITNGVDIRHIKTTRVLAAYTDKFGIKTDIMYQGEVDKEFGDKAKL
ncbi:MAG: CHAP domain-containing protein [Streptococcus sp.]|nr:CHAP domain-containing protein [Streptococcus sp.]